MFSLLIFLYFANNLFYELLEDPNMNLYNPKGITAT